MILVVFIVLVTIYVAKVDEKSLRSELGKLISGGLIVFLSVFLAQHFSNTAQNKRESKHILNLLYATKIQIESFNMFLLSCPASYEDSKHYLGSSYKPLDFFKHNPMYMPKIVDITLSDTSVLRIMHPQSMTSIFDELENANKALNVLNNRNIDEKELQNSVNNASLFLSNLSKFLDYEMSYQNQSIDEEKLFNFHRELMKLMDEKPVSQLIRLNNS